MMNYYAYLYIDPITDIPFYVGKGKGKRAYVLHNHNKLVIGKIRNLNNLSLQHFVELVPATCELSAYWLERMLIAAYGRKDIKTGSLFNHSDGGEGNALFGERNGRYNDHRNWEQLYGDKAKNLKETMSIKNTGINNPMYGKKRPDLVERNVKNNSQRNNISVEKNRLSHLGKRFKQKTQTCFKCGKIGGVGGIKRYHNERCKYG